MSDLISRQTAMNAFAEHVKRSNNSDFAPTPTWNDAVDIVENLPSADIDLSGFSDRLWKAAYERGKAEVVRNGHWIYTPTNLLGYTCSECGKAMCRFNYCPHCGAKME